jgi:molybdopterin molybdotransferase
VTSPAGLRHYLRGALEYRDGVYHVSPAEGQGSHQIFSLSSSNALMVVGEETTALAAGDEVDVMRLP